MSAEAELVRLERQVLGIARVSKFTDAVESLRRALAREDPRLRELVLKLVAPAVGRDLAAAVGAAWNIGVTDAVSIIDEGKAHGIPATPPKGIIEAAKLTEKTIADRMKVARKLARGGADDASVLAPVLAAANDLKRDVVTLVNHAGNAGTTAAADAAGLPTVWVAETNACVICLAYSGRIAKPGKSFPGGLTYGAKAYDGDALPYPPRHPHCRCTVEPLRSRDYADALRREADRSVLRGFSLESESMKTRIDAAARLVEKGVDAPKSVVAFARRSIKAGEFPTRGRP